MRRVFPNFLAFVSLTAVSNAQAPADPPEIAQRREEHLRNLQRAAVPVYEAYLRALDPLKAQFAREGKYDALTALQSEIKKTQNDLEAAKSAAARKTGGSLGLVILSATYGAHDKNRTINITENLRRAIRQGDSTIKLNTDEGAGGKDPAPFVKKESVISYTINGQRREKTFSEGHKLDFKADLN